MTDIGINGYVVPPLRDNHLLVSIEINPISLKNREGSLGQPK
jgi:hypothetical protein